MLTFLGLMMFLGMEFYLTSIRILEGSKKGPPR